MSSTRQPSSSQSADKAPAERLTPLARRDLEIANLERQVRDLRQQNDELWSENDDLKTRATSWVTLLGDLKAREASLKAKDEIIKGLSTDLANLEWETKAFKEHNVELQDLFRKHHEEILAAGERHRLKVTNTRKVKVKDSGSVPLADSKKAETKQRAELPQPQQSSSDILAGELESENVSNDAIEGKSETVMTAKDKVTHGAGSRATFLDQCFIDAEWGSAPDPLETSNKKQGPKKARVPSKTPADERYAVPPTDTPKADEQSRAGFRASAPSLVSSSPLKTPLSTPTGTDGQGSGDQHGLKHMHPKDHIRGVRTSSAPQAHELLPRARNSSQPADVRPLTTPHQPESVKNYAQMAAEPTPYAWATTSFSWAEKLAPVLRAEAQKAAESSKSIENPTLGVDGSSMSRKRSLSQISSVPDLSQKKPKPSSRDFSPPTTPTEAELEALRASLGRNERDGRKSEGWGKWERRSWE